jgi:hypothetical protein
MRLDPAIIASLTRRLQLTGYLRTARWAHRSTPLGMGFGKTRFASPVDGFKLMYLAKDLPTSIAEAIIRDRFEGTIDRVLTRGEVADWGVCEVSAAALLRVLDLRGNGCFELGVSTDIAGGKAQDEAREFSQTRYDTTDLDGIIYRSRLRKQQDCVAVYDRAVSPALMAGPVVEMESLAALVPALRALKIKLI